MRSQAEEAPAADLEAIQAGKQDIEQNDVVNAAFREIQAAKTLLRYVDDMPLPPQVGREGLRDARIVLDNQYPHRK